MPDDPALLSRLKVERTGLRSDTTFYALLDGKAIGWVSVFVPEAVSEDLDTYDEEDGDWYVDTVTVVEEYRRKGVATFLYLHMKKCFGYIPGSKTRLTKEGRQFRDALNRRVYGR